MNIFSYLRRVVILTLLASGTHASIKVASLPQSSLVPGGIAVIPTEIEAIEGNYRNERVLLANYNGVQYAIVGIPLTVEAGKENLYLDLPGGQKRTISFQVKAKTYTEQHLTVTNSRQVNPNPSDMERISRERAEMDSAFSSWNENFVPTFEVNNVFGSAPIGFNTTNTISLRNQRVGTAATIAAGKEIGQARIYDFALESGAYDSAAPKTNVWDLSLFDLEVNTDLTVNVDTSLSVPTHIEGENSGASGFLRYAAVGTAVTIYNTILLLLVQYIT